MRQESLCLVLAAALAAAVPTGARAECVVQPTFTPNFEPELEWAWSSSTILPSHKQVMMTPAVADVNLDGVPDVIFNTFSGVNYNTDGVLRAVSGANGAEIWTVIDPAHRVRGASTVSAGDIDNDGKVELCTIPANGAGFICFENDGTFKFRTNTPANSWGGVSFADLTGDGTVEIIAGNQVFSSTGTLLWTGLDGVGGIPGTGPVSFAADIDQDGLLEVINDRAVYEHDGTLKWRNLSIGHGLAGIGNFDADPYGEVVVVWGGRVSLLDHDGVLLWTTLIPGGGAGGAPNIADFDNDGQAEIGVAGASRYVVFETNGTVKWQSAVQDFSSNRTGSSTFDFEGDGKAEAVYADERFLRIYDGATGAVRFQVANPSGTTYENPLIVDVDADGNAEIVVISNNYAFAGTNGIRVFRDANDGWVNTRKIWNQHAYSVTNINEDGTIPTIPQTNWLTPGLNTFRSNSQGTSSTAAFAASNLQITSITGACVPGSTEAVISATVLNAGDAGASGGLHIAFYSGATLLNLGTVPGVIPPGGSATVSFSIAVAPPTLSVTAVADDDGAGQGSETECNESDNSASADLALGCTPNQPPVAQCQDVTVDAGPTCTAAASIDDGSYDPDGDDITLSQSPTTFALGATGATLTVSDGTDSDQCMGTVTVVDQDGPVVSCAAALTVPANGTCGADVSALIELEVDDNCTAAGDLTVTLDPPGGVLSGTGTHTVTATVTDAAGLASTCQTTVTVVDNSAPAVACPGDVGLECTDGGAEYAWSLSALGDNCPGVTAVCDPASPAGFPLGTAGVSCTATDAAGNTAGCTFTVYVADTLAPSIACSDAHVLECASPAGTPATTSATADDQCDASPMLSTDAPEVFGLGSTTVTWTAVDGAGLTATCQSTVDVADTTDPTITCPADVTAECSNGAATVSLAAAEASDACDGDPTVTPGSTASYALGTTTVTSTATDDTGNDASCTTAVTVEDTTPPTATATASAPLLWPPNHKYHTITAADCFASATDACSPTADILATATVVQAWSDEVEDAPESKGAKNGDGNTLDDILLDCGGGSVQLRAERLGGSDGRVYTLVWRLTDPAGNTATATCTVGVPHDQGGQATPVDSGSAYGEICP